MALNKATPKEHRSVVTLVYVLQLQLFEPLHVLHFAICSDDRLSECMTTDYLHFIYTYAYIHNANIYPTHGNIPWAGCLHFTLSWPLYILQISLASVCIPTTQFDLCFAALFSSFTAFSLGNHFHSPCTYTLLGGINSSISHSE